MQEITQYIQQTGRVIEEMSRGKDGEGEKESHKVFFPEGAYIKEVRFIRPGYEQIDVAFPGGILVWYRLTEDGRECNRLGLHKDSYRVSMQCSK